MANGGPIATGRSAGAARRGRAAAVGIAVPAGARALGVAARPGRAPAPQEHDRARRRGHRRRARSWWWPSSRTCWRPRARSPAIRPRPSQRPSWDHPLGTDQLGRDMLSRVIHGTRISLVVGVSSVLLALFVGVPFGMIAGYYGGRIDTRHHARDGPDPRLPDLPARHHPDGHLHAHRRAHRHHEGDGRHRHRAHPDLRAAGPGQRAVDQGEGVHRGLPGARRARSVDPLAPRAAELPGADHRDHHARHRDVDHRGGHALASSAWAPSRRRRAGAGTSRPTSPSSRPTPGSRSSRAWPSSSPCSASTSSATASATRSIRA